MFRSKEAVIVEPAKPTPISLIGDTSADQRVSHSYAEETFASGDETAFMHVPSGVNLDSKKKFDSTWPVFDLCNDESSKLHHFIQSIVVVPRLVITAAHRALFNAINELAAMESTGKGDGRFEFYYVSAGPLANGYYLSALLFRHSLFETEPIFPAAFMIHERKDADDHRLLFELVRNKCPEVLSTECVFITDREFGDIKSVLPSALQCFSWHYFEDDIANWVETNGGTVEEANTYIHDVFILMKSKNADQFHREYATKKRQWSPDFAHFFDTCLKPDIAAKGGRWHADSGRMGTYDPFCGVVIPPCIDLNQLVSELMEWQDMTLDQLMLCIYYFTEYYVRENEMSMHQSGAFKFKPRFLRAARPVRRLRVFAPAEVSEPKDVVTFVKTYSLVSRPI